MLNHRSPRRARFGACIALGATALILSAPLTTVADEPVDPSVYAYAYAEVSGLTVTPVGGTSLPASFTSLAGANATSPAPYGSAAAADVRDPGEAYAGPGGGRGNNAGMFSSLGPFDAQLGDRARSDDFGRGDALLRSSSGAIPSDQALTAAITSAGVAAATVAESYLVEPAATPLAGTPFLIDEGQATGRVTVNSLPFSGPSDGTQYRFAFDLRNVLRVRVGPSTPIGATRNVFAEARVRYTIQINELVPANGSLEAVPVASWTDGIANRQLSRQVPGQITQGPVAQGGVVWSPTVAWNAGRQYQIEIGIEAIVDTRLLRDSRPAAVLEVTKEVTGTARTDWSFDLSISPVPQGQPAIRTVTAAQPLARWTGLQPGVAYTVSEAPANGYVFRGLRCGDGPSGATTVTPDAAPTAAQTIRCTARNEADPPDAPSTTSIVPPPPTEAQLAPPATDSVPTVELPRVGTGPSALATSAVAVIALLAGLAALLAVRAPRSTSRARR